MKLSLATVILLFSQSTALNINPHRRYNDVVINTALSSTAFDTRAPPVSVSENYNDQAGIDVDFISSALLEPPLVNAHYNGVDGEMNDGLYEENGWSDEFAFERMRKRQVKQPQQQFRHNSQPVANNRHQQQHPISQQLHQHRVMTGSERRATWESYARPGIAPRHVDSYSGGVVGSPNGMGDWGYTSMYGPATSVSAFDQRRGDDAYYQERADGGKPNLSAQRPNRASYNMGSTIGFESQRPSNRESSYHVDSTVTTGAQRRAGFQNIHSYEPQMVEGARYHDVPGTSSYHSLESPDQPDEIISSDSLNGFEPPAPAQFDMNNVKLSELNYDLDLANSKARFDDFKPAPALEIEDDTDKNSMVTNKSSISSNSPPLTPSNGSYKSAPLNGTTSQTLKRSGSAFPINGMSSAMFKDPKIGLKGKDHSSKGSSGGKSPLNGVKAHIFNGVKAQSLKGSEPMSFSKTKLSTAPDKGELGGSIEFSGGSNSSSSFIGSGGGMNSGIKKGLGGVVLKGKQPSQASSPFGVPSTSKAPNPSKHVANFAKGNVLSKGPTSSAPVAGMFGKTSGFGFGNSAKSASSSTAPLKVVGGPMNGLFGKTKSPFKGVGGPSGNMPNKGIFEPSASFANSGGGNAMPNKFKPFIPSSNASSEEDDSNISLPVKPEKFVDFVSRQGNSQSGALKQAMNDQGQPAPISQESGIQRVGNRLANTSPNKFKAFVPSFKTQQDAQGNESPPEPDLASFLQHPIYTKRDAEDVAASLSALSPPPIFYNDFESSDTVEEPLHQNEGASLNFAITNGVIQDMPAPTEVPMNTPARQSLPPYLSLHPIPGKGLGVITNKAFKIGEFIGNYEGEIMSEEVKDRRYLKSLEHKLTDEDREWIQNRLDRGQTITGTYLYGVDLNVGNAYKHFGRKNEDAEEEIPDRIFVDAEDEYESLWTRFINHASPPADNLKPMSVPESYDGKPRVWFMAKRDIEPGEELCFDYGEDYWLEGDEVY